MPFLVDQEQWAIHGSSNVTIGLTDGATESVELYEITELARHSVDNSTLASSTSTRSQTINGDVESQLEVTVNNIPQHPGISSTVALDGTTFGTESTPNSQPNDIVPPAAVVSASQPGSTLKTFQLWLKVVGCFLLFVNSWGFANSYGVYQSYYRSDGGPLKSQTDSNVAWVGSVQVFLLLACTIITGHLFDRGYCRWLLVIGTTFLVLGMGATGLSTRYYQFLLAQGVCMGMGMSCLFIPSVAIIPRILPEHRSLALGIATSGSCVGGIIWPMAFNALRVSVGFEWTCLIFALTMLLSNVLAICLIYTIPHTPSAPGFFDPSALHQTSFTTYTAAYFFCLLTLYTPIFFGVTFASSALHMPPVRAFNTAAWTNAGSIPGRLIPGFLADKFTPFPVLVLCTLSCAAVAFSWTAVHSEAGFDAFCVAYGALSGAFVSLQASATAALTRDRGMMGRRMGMNSFLGGLGLLAGQPLAGYLLRRGGWFAVQVFTGAGVGVAATFVGVCWVCFRRGV